jgi:hypothetical protein
MERDEQADDIKAIDAIIARQFASLNWQAGGLGDWDGFASDFFPGASLYPATRPVRLQSVESFVERMRGLAQSTLRSFHERVLGTQVRVFGNVAVAVAACEMAENETEVNRGVEMLLLVKDNGVWQIVSQAWDSEGPRKPIPPELMYGVSGPGAASATRR